MELDKSSWWMTQILSALAFDALCNRRNQCNMLMVIQARDLYNGCAGVCICV